MISKKLLEFLASVTLITCVIHSDAHDPDDLCKILESLIDVLQALTPEELTEVLGAFESARHAFVQHPDSAKIENFIRQLSLELYPEQDNPY
ncbi:MAG: hypothetical protein HC888_18700 [Candidatus Competibacteraceae bacterium]|nr:hypothetical protein [Candidatus Competibacteraceae bacterium]